MESLSIPVGYGVELSTLLDTAATRGLDAIAQVDLGSRGHKHQTDHDLALTAAELLIGRSAGARILFETSRFHGLTSPTWLLAW